MPDGQGLLLVISGPSGVGKTTITESVRDRLDGEISISVTTRPKASDDEEGGDYYFVSRDRFRELVEQDVFLEHAEVFGSNYYGTPREPVENAVRDGRLVILEIDVQGAFQVKTAVADALMIFILPPSEEELLRRLRDRGREDEATIQRRFEEAKLEIRTAEESGQYDVFIVNDDLERAINEACRLVTRHRGASV